MRSLQFVFVAATITVSLPTIVSAHHSRGNFNLDEVLELQGTISEFTWRNPHTFAKLAVETESGGTTELLLELNSIAVLSREGWTADTLSVGDEVTVFASPDFDASKNLFFSNYFVLPDGSLKASSPGTAPDFVPREPRRRVDRTARSDDLSGIWRIEGARFGPRRGGRGGGMGGGNAAPPSISLGGQTPAIGLPLTALGQAEVDAWDPADNPWFRCEPRTSPWSFSGPGAHQIIRGSDDAVIIRHEINDVQRTVHLNLSEHPAGTELTHQGHSIGWFEGETLVVDTAFFAPAQWGIGSAVSSSDQKHLVERFTLLDDGRRMRFEYTLEDPVYLTQPVTLSQTFFLDAGYPWPEAYACNTEASGRHLVE